MTDPGEKTSPIMDRLNQIDELINSIEQRSCCLQARLECVSIDSPPEPPTSTGSKAICCCPMESRLTRFVNELQDTDKRLAKMIQNLQL